MSWLLHNHCALDWAVARLVTLGSRAAAWLLVSLAGRLVVVAVVRGSVRRVAAPK